MLLTSQGSGTHAGLPIAVAGAALETASGALILLHGRGGNAADMLALAQQVMPPRVAALAPQAAGHSWYPHAFTEPRARNEPALSSALSMVEALIAELLRAGLAEERIALLGFSQGACLALEVAARHGGQLGCAIGFSGGLIGATIDVAGMPRHDGLRVLLGCAERDPHIPLHRVRATNDVLQGTGARVDTRIYPGSGHTINQDEIERATRLLAGLPTG